MNIDIHQQSLCGDMSSTEKEVTPLSPPPIEEAPRGVAVNLAEALATIELLAAFYGQYNRASGFSQAVNLPGIRTRLQERMAGNVDEIAASMRQKATAGGYLATEAALFEPLAKEKELIDAGFDPREVADAAAGLGVIALRRRIGTTVRAPQRQRMVRSLRRLATKK